MYAAALRGMWDTHTIRSERNQEAFFYVVQQAVDYGRPAALVMLDDGTLRIERSDSADDMTPITVEFVSETARSEFLQTLEALLAEGVLVDKA